MPARKVNACIRRISLVFSRVSTEQVLMSVYCRSGRGRRGPLRRRLRDRKFRYRIRVKMRTRLKLPPKLPRLACWLCCASYPHGNPNFTKSIAATLHGYGWEASASCSSISFVSKYYPFLVLPAAATYGSSRPSGLSFFDFNDGFFRYFALLYFTTSARSFTKETKKSCVYLRG